MSRSLSRWQVLLMGVAVLIGLGGGGFLLFSVASRQWLWTDTFHVRVGFRQIQGVEAGTRVRVLGKEAGEVEKVELPGTPSGQVVLLLRLDGRLRHLVRADATAEIVAEGMVGGKVVEIDPGSDAAGVVADQGVIRSVPTRDPLARAAQLLQTLDNEKARVHEVVDNTNKLLVQGRQTMASIQAVAEGVKRLPVVRSYVEDPRGLLYRPNCERNRQVLAAAELFEPGRAVLTDQGRQHLNDLGPWLDGLTKHEGAEVVIAAYADQQEPEPALARQLTQQQSEAVYHYLRGEGVVYKKFGLFSRKVTPYGLGTNPPPVPEADNLPTARVEVLVFVPQG